MRTLTTTEGTRVMMENWAQVFFFSISFYLYIIGLCYDDTMLHNDGRIRVIPENGAQTMCCHLGPGFFFSISFILLHVISLQ